ncbi:MAG: type II secretion system protein [Rhodospirillaceae bacterium]
MASKGYLAQMRGFTLIEISIVLVVIGLLLSGGLVALGPVLQNAKRTETENTLTKVEDAILLYTIQHSCLPCPADGSLVTGSGNDGRSETNTGAFYISQCSDDAGGASCRADSGQNVVPWVTLGLSEADAIDAWGNRLYYGVTTGLDLADSMDRSGTTYPAGTLDVGNIADASDPSDNVTGVAAYVLFSFGQDGSDARASQSGALRTDRYNSADQDENSDGATDGFVQDSPVDIDGNTYFDDILRWKSAPIIVQQCGSGVCGNP